jgi:hypothetical protein
VSQIHVYCRSSGFLCSAQACRQALTLRLSSTYRRCPGVAIACELHRRESEYRTRAAFSSVNGEGASQLFSLESLPTSHVEQPLFSCALPLKSCAFCGSQQQLSVSPHPRRPSRRRSRRLLRGAVGPRVVCVPGSTA